MNLRVSVTDSPGTAAPFGLQDRGPVVQVDLVNRVTHEKRSGLALIDTGAKFSCFDQEVATELSMPIVDRGWISSATGRDLRPVYSGRIAVHSLGNFDADRAFGASLQDDGLIVLLGRDALQHAVLVYNGAEAAVSIAL
ncbi:MAG: hypothetical protein OXR83_00590 [Acidobacteriota bacterium]|nr:hypothetical protein [Acidobacteriota bacterium]